MPVIAAGDMAYVPEAIDPVVGSRLLELVDRTMSEFVAETTPEMLKIVTCVMVSGNLITPLSPAMFAWFTPCSVILTSCTVPVTSEAVMMDGDGFEYPGMNT